MKARLADIQGLRAIAALGVVLFHATPWLPGGFLGVDVFFVISGYIVTRLARVEIAATGEFFSLGFMRRRLMRVVPPMAIVVLATLAAFLPVDTPTHLIRDLPMAGFAALTGWINIYFLSHATDYFQTFQSNPLLHLWSLSVEIQFYVLFALAMKLARPLIFQIALILTAASLAGSLLIRHSGIALPDVFSFFMLPTRLWEFGFGIIANYVQRPWKARAATINSLQIASLLLLLAGLQFGSSTQLVPGYQAIAPCFGTAALIATGERGIISRALSWRPLTYFGDRSYSIYLWQGPLIVLAAILFATPFAIWLGAILSILVSMVSYRTVETIFRHSERWLPFPSAWAGAALACVAVYFAVPITIGRLEAPKGLRATFLDEKCERQRGSLGIAPCVYGPDNAPKVLLIGDSHAGAISQAVVDAAAQAGWQAHIATASACSVPEYPEAVAFRPSCSGYTANILNYAREKHINFVVLLQFSEFYTNDLGISPDRWKVGLSQVVAEFGRTPVLIIGGNLRLPLAVGRPFWSNSWRVDLGNEIANRKPLDDAERSGAISNPNGRYWPAMTYLCDGSRCPVFENGAWQYTDTDHLSHRGAEPLIEPIIAALHNSQKDCQSDCWKKPTY